MAPLQTCITELEQKLATCTDDLQKAQQKICELEHRLSSQTQSLQDIAVDSTLVESEAMFHSVFEQAAVGLAYLDLEGRYQLVNQKFCEIVGYSQAELLTRTFIDITHPNDLEIELAYIAQLMNHKIPAFSLENRYIRQDGSIVWVRLSISGLYRASGQLQLFLAAVTEITEQKRIETELQALNQNLAKRVQERTQALEQSQEILRQQEEQFRQIFDCAPISIILVEAKTMEFLRVNPVICDLLGYEPEELLQQSVEEITHPEDLKPDLALTEQLVSGQIPQFQMEKRYIRKTGELIWGFLTVTLIRDQQGQPLYCLGMIEDITERKRADEKLRASLQEKEVLLKEIHHRVKNNMQMVSSLLNLQASSIPDPKILAPFRESQNRIKVMALIHERLYQSDSLARVRFSEYVNILVKDLLRSYTAVSSRIAIACTIANVELDVDTAMACGLIVNELVCNAIKYAFPNNRLGKITVHFTFTPSNRYLLTVADDGVGLPPHLDPDTVESLGLQLVNTLVLKLQGSLDLDRQNGTMFSVAFDKID